MTDEEIDLISSRIRNDMKKRIDFCDNVGITLDDYYVKQCGDFEIEDMVRAYENGRMAYEEGYNKLLDVINNQDVKIADLEKKVKEYEYLGIKELQSEAERLAKGNNYLNEQLEQAKVIIATLLKNQPPPENVYDIGKFDIDDYRDIIEQAEQFIKENK